MLRHCSRSATLFLAGCVIALAMFGWAAPVGAAHLSRVHRLKSVPQRPSSLKIPRTAYFRETPGRGLIVSAWINGTGPYNFALDTGAGATIVSSRVAAQAGVAVIDGRVHRIAGLSGTLHARTARDIKVRSLAIGDRDNMLPAGGAIMTADIFPGDIDGVLDPTESYWPLGYVIDFPRGALSAFDPALMPLRSSQAPVGGTVVPWVREASGRRPYVLLDDGQKALLDTGSEFGLALRDNSIGSAGDPRSSERRPIQDLGGGTISARRVAPLTIAIGSLALQRIPTDLVSGLEAGAPVLLGRAALRPFKLSFDPINRLIEIAPG